VIDPYYNKRVNKSDNSIFRDLLAKACAVIADAKGLAVFSGAGLSAESGIATFRDTETDALWSRFDPMELASAQGFEANPERVADWYQWRRTKLATVQPNPAHFALAASPSLVHITQNVDDLSERAGADPDNVIHVHGTITKDHCHAQCGYEENIDLAEPPALRRCPKCSAFMRPSVVWFGEGMPPEAWSRAAEVSQSADCLLVIGTSATVYPAAGLIEVVNRNGGAIIVINTNSSEASHLATVELIGVAGDIVPRLLLSGV
jgi:NAD-dependent deacetylase